MFSLTANSISNGIAQLATTDQSPAVISFFDQTQHPHSFLYIIFCTIICKQEQKGSKENKPWVRTTLH
jgi:hypothetical protein